MVPVNANQPAAKPAPQLLSKTIDYDAILNQESEDSESECLFVIKPKRKLSSDSEKDYGPTVKAPLAPQDPLKIIEEEPQK